MPRPKKSKTNDMFVAENGMDDFAQDYTIETLSCITTMPIIGSGAPLRFLIKSIKGEYIDPNHLVMNLKFKIWKKGAGGVKTKMPDGEKITPYCGFLYTMFKDVMVDFNGVNIYTTHQQYQHLAYLGILLNAPHSMKNTVMEAALWKQDQAGAFDLIDPALSTLNPGAYWRMTFIKESTEFEMKGPLLIDCLKVSKPILDGVDIGLSFYPHDPNLCLTYHKTGAVAVPDYVIEIVGANLEVGRIRPKQSTVPKAIYPYVHREMLHMIHDKNLSYFGPTTVASGILPKRVIVGLVSETAYSGTLTKNRLKFRNFKVDNVVIRVNSADKPIGGGYKMEYNNQIYSQPYYGLFKELGQGFGGVQVGPIDFKDYDSGYALYAFDTSPGHDASSMGKMGTGNCELMIHFSKATTDNVVVLVMLEYDRKYTMLGMDSGNVRQFKFENVLP